MANKQVKISDFINLLDEGKNRDQIAEALGMTRKEVDHHFKHPQLKGKKPRKPFIAEFELIDDVSEDTNEVEWTQEEVVATPIDEQEEAPVEEAAQEEAPVSTWENE